MKRLITVTCLSFSFLYSFSQRDIEVAKIELSHSVEDTTRVQLMADLGFAFFSVNIDSAIFYANSGLQLARSIKYTEGERACLSSLANALSERDIPKSMQAYFQALQISEELNDKRGIASCYESIGLLHLYLDNSSLYIVNLKKARAIFEELNDLTGVASCNSEIGGAILGEDDDSARYYLTLAMKDPSQMKSPYFNYYLGRLEGAVNPPLARFYFYQSLQIFKKTNSLRGLSLANRWLSKFYEAHGQFDSSIIAAKNGLDASQQLNFLRGTIYNSTQLAVVYKKLSQIDSAHKYLSIMVEAKDKLLGPDKINQIQNAIIEEQQRGQNLLAEKTLLQNRVRLYASLAIAFVLLLFVLFFYRNQRRIQRSNSLLQKQRDEINTKRSELQDSIDALKLTQAQLIQSEKMASLGELTAGIAHEIQNPLNFVNNFSEMNRELLQEMNEAIDKSQYNEVKVLAANISSNEEKINHHGKRADAIVKGMLQHSRTGTGKKEPIDINALADEYLRLSYHGLRVKDKSFNAMLKTSFDDSIRRIDVMPQDIGRVLLNLFNNAFYSVNQKQKQYDDSFKPMIEVSTKREGTNVVVNVKDNGTGIPEKVLNKIYQPFFTTKPTGEGTGLGLSLSYDIITKGHGGEMKVETKEGDGAEFIIRLPIS